MDAVFFLDEEARARFFQTLAQALGCTYICLWSYYPSPPTNQLFSLYAWFNATNEPSSSTSSQSIVRTLFDAYRRTLYSVESGFVPGLAFKEGVPFLEVKDLELLSRASTDIQRQFYLEARIKMAVFMGCKSGEMEIGMSTLDQTTSNMEMELMNWFPDHFSQHAKLRMLPQSWPSSSSSSLRSLSVGSSEYSSLLLNMPTTSSFLPEQIEQITNSISVLQPNQQIVQAEYNALGNIQFPNAENDDALMTRAMLAVISSPSSSSTSQQTRACGSQLSQETGGRAFRIYMPSLVPNNVQFSSNSGGQDMLKRTIVFYKNMYLRRRITEEQVQGGSHPTSSQLHHKMSERKRREKLNESFVALRSLLPPGSKKDKVSLLSNTRDYLTALKAEVAELKKKNRLLEARLAPISRGASSSEEAAASSGSSYNRVEIRITQASESTSQEREIDLQVTVTRNCDFMDLVSRLLEFLKQMIGNVSLEYIEGSSQQSQLTNPSYRVIFRLKIKVNQIFDESVFQEAIKRVVDDMTK